MEVNKSKIRTSAEDLILNKLLHIGFSRPLLAEASIREDGTSFGKHAVHRSHNSLIGKGKQLAHQQHSWPVRPVVKIPGTSVRSNDYLIEMSLLSGAMYHLFGDEIYQELQMPQILEAYDLYTNIRKTAGNISNQISPDTAFWLVREFVSHSAFMAHCEPCSINYYSSVEQSIVNACPFCKQVGKGDMAHPDNA